MGVTRAMLWNAIAIIVLLFALIALLPDFDGWDG
jgi:hypothetical protein